MKEEIKPENMRIHSRADELIACLEGEIAKRDARIVELEARIVWLECESQVSAAPVSEAKAQGVVMPQSPHWPGDDSHLSDYERGHLQGRCDMRSEVIRLNAAPVQQVSVPASAFASRAITHYEAALLAAFPSGSSGEVFNQWNEARRVLAAAPSPAGVDGLGNTAKLLLPALRQYMHNDGSGLLAGYDLETTQAIIDGLRGEVAELQAMITNLSRAGIRMRTERDQQAQRIGELDGLLREIGNRCEQRDMPGEQIIAEWSDQIDAALYSR